MIKILICSVVFLSYSFSFAGEFKIFHPSDGYLTISKKIHLIFSSKAIDGIKLSVNGKEVRLSNPTRVKTKDREYYIFMVDIFVNKGNNKVSISDLKSTETINIHYTPSTLIYRDKIKRNTFFHQSDIKSFCSGCHNFDSIKDCNNCHKDKLTAKFVHGPVASSNCNQCHDKNNYYSLIQPVTKKCLACHDEFNKKFYSYKFVHGPVGAGMCTVCHDPHVSDDKMLLQDSINNLCEYCHSDKKTGVHILINFNRSAHPTSNRFIKSLKEQLTCISCHDPHYGSTKQLYRDGSKDFLTLCVKCHKDKL